MPILHCFSTSECRTTSRSLAHRHSGRWFSFRSRSCHPSAWCMCNHAPLLPAHGYPIGRPVLGGGEDTVTQSTPTTRSTPTTMDNPTSMRVPDAHILEEDQFIGFDMPRSQVEHKVMHTPLFSLHDLHLECKDVIISLLHTRKDTQEAVQTSKPMVITHQASTVSSPGVALAIPPTP